MSAGPDDPRPHTAVLIQHAGIGDLVWHVEYFRRVAQTSRGGRIAVIAPPSTQARDLLGHEPWVETVIDFDRRPRQEERRFGRHSGLHGLLHMGRELRPHGFDRIALFTTHPVRPWIAAWRAGIAQRLGFGSTGLQRLLLTRTRWIERYRGPAAPVYQDCTAFAIAQGWADAPIVPRISVRDDALARMRAELADLPRPFHALAIGTSEPHKQWGLERFADLAGRLTAQGQGVLLVGGPGESALADAILARLPPGQRARARALTRGSVADSVAALSLAASCLGNDTGAVNIAAAVGVPTHVLLGPRPLLLHDPARLHCVQAAHLDDIQPADVARLALSHGLPAADAAPTARTQTLPAP